jgi:dTDP-4-dehydrorhamnose reductase
MKVLITGAKGMLAHSLIPILREKHTVIPLPREELDITERHCVYKTIKDTLPNIVINCAAYTKVDKAEEEREKAFLINGTGVQNLALACAEKGIPLVHISTDYIFDGEKKTPYTPFDIPNPLNVYGQSKLAGERYIQWITNKFYIIRTSWLYGEGGNNFVSAILKKAREQSTIRVVKDQIGSPTYTTSLSNSIKRLIESGAYGIYHITDETDGGISWSDFAKEIISLLGLKTEVIPVPTEEFPTPARRPKYSVLDTQMARLSLKINLPFWRDELQKFLTSALPS